MYKYYESHINCKNRPEWMKYVDNLSALGRTHGFIRDGNEDYTRLKEEEYRRLASLLFKDSSISMQDEIITEFNKTEIFNKVSVYIESKSIDAEKSIADLISKNVIKSYQPVIKEIFDQVRTIHGENYNG